MSKPYLVVGQTYICDLFGYKGLIIKIDKVGDPSNFDHYDSTIIYSGEQHPQAAGTIFNFGHDSRFHRHLKVYKPTKPAKPVNHGVSFDDLFKE